MSLNVHQKLWMLNKSLIFKMENLNHLYIIYNTKDNVNIS